MFTSINTISEKFLNKKLDEASAEEIKVFVEKYPYSASARLLLAKKVGEKDEESILTASLYINNPLRISWLLENNDIIQKVEDIHSPLSASLPEQDIDEETDASPVEITETSAKPEGKSSDALPPAPALSIVLPGAAEIANIRKNNSKPALTDEPLIFQSYHTIDYFASQGIRLQQSDLSKDKFGKQLKSFTEWLRSMKKLPAPSVSKLSAGDDPTVIRNAANSIEEKEVLTEAMAEVWAKQGDEDKAIAIYTKLSLQNPDKSAYFASKIDQLKQL